MKREPDILNNVVEIGQIHQQRLNFAHRKISPLMPLVIKRYNHMSEEDISYMDQYVFRFSKLQDVLGQKLFKILLITLGEAIEGKAFIDLFNRLE